MHKTTIKGSFSIADPGCLSRIPDPDFYPSRISDPGSKNSNKRERWKKTSCHTFLCSHKFHKIVNYFSFEVLKKKIWVNFQRIIELFTQKIVSKLSKIWVWDPGSGKNLFRIPDPGSRGQKGTGSRIQIRNTGSFCYYPENWRHTVRKGTNWAVWINFSSYQSLYLGQWRIFAKQGAFIKILSFNLVN